MPELSQGFARIRGGPGDFSGTNVGQESWLLGASEKEPYVK